MSKTKILMLIILAFILDPFCIKAQVMDSPPNDGVFDKIHVVNRKPIPYAPLREADAFFTKRIWRIIDMREKINHPFYYPTIPQNGRSSFMQVILDAIKEGSITAYDASSGDEFLVPYTYDQIIQNLSSTDTITAQRPDPPYDYFDTVYTKEFDPSSVKQLRMKEDWFFDKQRSVMDVRILGICPILEELDDNGEKKGDKPLFWIYFPEAREIFAKAEVFNRFNDAERRTYEDVFFKRLFNSYIYKESNVYDRRIYEYARGLDALLESERIKNDLFLFEHDLWEY